METSYIVWSVAVTTMPNRTLSFQVIFTGCESDDQDEENIHGGAMWARMPLTALVADTPLEEWPTELPPYLSTTLGLYVSYTLSI